MKTLARTLSLLLCVFSGAACAADALVTFNVVLLQPDFVLQERAPDINALAGYIKAVEESGRAALIEQEQHPTSSGFIAIAVRPNQKSNVWLDFSPPLPPNVANSLVSQIRAVKPFAAHRGIVVFALKVGTWGGREVTQATPAPAEWTAVAKKVGRPLEVGELVDLVWGK